MKSRSLLLYATLLAGMMLAVSSCKKEQETPVVIDIAYTAQNNNHTVPVSVTFANKTTGATHFHWTFEGGNPAESNRSDPGTVMFHTAGTHKVTLDAWNEDGRASKALLLNLDSMVMIDFDTTILDSHYSPVTVKLSNKTTGASSYEWTFEGGTPSSSKVADPGNVVFATPGAHAITLKVSNGGSIFTLTKSVTVAPLLAAAFTIDPSFDDDDYEAPLTATLHNSSVSTATWQWTSTGGTLSATNTHQPTVQFNTPGTYTVTLLAANGKASQTVSQTIVVKPNSNLRTLRDVKFGISSAQQSVGVMYATKLRRNFRLSDDLSSNGNIVDLLFVGVNQGFSFNRFISPDSAQYYGFPAIPGAGATVYINSQEGCQCSTSMSGTTFDAMTTDAALQALSINQPTGGATNEFDGSVLPRIVLFRTADGRKGAIKIKSFVQAGADSYILTDIKVQKNF